MSPAPAVSVAALISTFEMSEISFEANEMLGQGAFSTVHRCEYKATSLALKMTPQLRQIGEKQRDEFLNEIKILQNINSRNSHPHIVRLVAVNQANLAMLFTPLVPHGRTLSNLVHDRRDMADYNVVMLRILGNCASALAAIHEATVCHLDFKALNVLIGGEGGFITASVCDFGISKPGEGVSGCLAGTPAMMPPEAADGVYGYANDVFAFGVTVWECFARQIPFPGMADTRDISACWINGKGLTEFQIADVSVRALFKQCTHLVRERRIRTNALVTWFLSKNKF
jgi:serine/threonine protein kinase